MLKLTDITKVYQVGDTKVEALRGVSIEFRKSEFVSVLGPSGCGKTTLLNIIGGLDRYTSGDLSVNGKPTKDFSDRDYDTYRNRSIGFVFQNYNLIPHQTVLANVELALTISGASISERKKRAIDALTRVGLADQIHKKPNQLSGGQMQRVAIARALVNDPEILLADEPTGALDSETSVSIMEILKEISKDRLVIMVTHNADLAGKYSTRIVRLLDGKITSDSSPYSSGEITAATSDKKKKKREKAVKKTSMSFLTALSLSLNNLLTKKTRTFMTSFAGSIGIIGIALILALSNGIQNYIDDVQEDTLSSYPIVIEAETVDIGNLMSAMMGVRSGEAKHELDAVYSSSVMYDLMNSLNSSAPQVNNLVAFREFLEKDENGLDEYISAVHYSYDLDFNIYTKDKNGEIIKSDIVALMESVMGRGSQSGNEATAGSGAPADSDLESLAAFRNNAMASRFSGLKVWEEMLPGEGGALVNSLLDQQYDVVYGRWPQSYEEVVLIVDENNEISDLVLYALGLKTSEEMREIMIASAKQESIEVKQERWTYEEICDMTFRLVPSYEFYQYDSKSGTYKDLRNSNTGVSLLYENGIELKISGIVRRNRDASSAMLSGAIGYTSALTEYIMEKAEQSELVNAQLDDPAVDVLTGLPFPSDEDAEIPDSEKAAMITGCFGSLSNAEKAAVYTSILSVPPEDHVNRAVEENMAGMTREYIETTLVEEYAAEMGVDTESVAKYIASMDDETLFAAVREQIAERVREQYAATIEQQLGSKTTDELAYGLDMTIANYSEAELADLFDRYMPQTVSDSTYEDNLRALGFIDRNSPSMISIYAPTFEAKDAIADIIADYNESVPEEDKITYTDYVALLMSSITSIINAISYVLIAFVAISLVVSSIMIGIITYISVLERTKEIGILRSIGASKKDISRVFNAETLIVGFISGAIGIGFSLFLTIPINHIIQTLTGISNIEAELPWMGGALLVVISMFLTLIAGLIPSRIAAKKDPVVALRTE
jgi:putative ABC transport system permease protein